MTPEKQRIAIAEACGWTHVSKFHTYRNIQGIPPGKTIQKHISLEIPDYLNDLNAMHEAEKMLQAVQRNWIFELCNVLGGVMRLDGSVHYADVSAIAHATAAQRAEAFLRTLNLWLPND